MDAIVFFFSFFLAVAIIIYVNVKRNRITTKLWETMERIPNKKVYRMINVKTNGIVGMSWSKLDFIIIEKGLLCFSEGNMNAYYFYKPNSFNNKFDGASDYGLINSIYINDVRVILEVSLSKESIGYQKFTFNFKDWKKIENVKINLIKYNLLVVGG
jgi:hypothetical protein